jgi:hypothetical protein
MKKHRLLLPATGLLLICVATLAMRSPDEAKNDKPVVVRGLLRDIACPIQNKQSTSRAFNRKCAEDCAKRGSPLAILTDNGTMYMTISESMPDMDQHEKLMPYVGKYVEASGIVYERNGMHSIVIKQIKEDKSVALKDDLE